MKVGLRGGGSCAQMRFIEPPHIAILYDYPGAYQSISILTDSFFPVVQPKKPKKSEKSSESKTQVSNLKKLAIFSIPQGNKKAEKLERKNSYNF